MKLRFTIFALLFFVFRFFAQVNNYFVIEYNYTNNLNYTNTKALLLYNDSCSVFKSFLKVEEEYEPKLQGNNIGIGGGLVNTYQENFLSKNKLFSYEALDEDIIKIEEEMPKFAWVFGSEVMKIGKFECNKATTSFRGRTYIAWYTTEIVCNFGPWKFNGLPGLIIDIEDVTKTYRWSYVQHNIEGKKNIEIEYTNFQTLMLKSYMAKRMESLEKLRARVRTAMPRGTEFKIPKNSRRGLEVVFEWEKLDE